MSAELGEVGHGAVARVLACWTLTLSGRNGFGLRRGSCVMAGPTGDLLPRPLSSPNPRRSRRVDPLTNVAAVSASCDAGETFKEVRQYSTRPARSSSAPIPALTPCLPRSARTKIHSLSRRSCTTCKAATPAVAATATRMSPMAVVSRRLCLPTATTRPPTVAGRTSTPQE